MRGIAGGGGVATGGSRFLSIFVDFFLCVRGGGGGDGREIKDPLACRAGTDGGL